MIRARSSVGLVASALILAACQTAGRTAYEAPLRQGELLDPPAAAQPQQAARTAEADFGLIDADTIAHDGRYFRISDLNPGERPSAETLEAGLWQSMDRVEQQARTSGNRVDDPELNAYLTEVACRVAGPHCSDVRVYVMRVPAFNATMAPNGMMQVWTGLLLRTRNEAQLAAVLGHEVGHFLRQHSAQRMKSAIEASNFLAFFSVATGGWGGLAGIFAQGQLLAFNRDHEREADGYGLLLMNRSGYDPREASLTWKNLIRERDANPEKDERDPFLATHPAPEERTEVLGELGMAVASKMPTTEKGRDRFLEIMLPRRAAWLRDELNLRSFHTSNELFDILLEDDPNPAEILFFKGELHRLRNDEDDAQMALDFYGEALNAAGSAPSYLHRSKGLVHNRRGDHAAAKESFEAYLEASPNASDRLIVEDMIERLATS
ncbi:MAG: M48 family metalloprotease [Proteobacteria bacterium]|nr:M48 family metalloprotease [Pseudomonadota bacterium]